MGSLKFSNWFNRRTKQQRRLQDTVQTFILEPIYTPSGFLDSGDDGEAINLSPEDLVDDIDSSSGSTDSSVTLSDTEAAASPTIDSSSEVEESSGFEANMEDFSEEIGEEIGEEFSEDDLEPLDFIDESESESKSATTTSINSDADDLENMAEANETTLEQSDASGDASDSQTDAVDEHTNGEDSDSETTLLTDSNAAVNAEGVEVEEMTESENDPQGNPETATQPTSMVDAETEVEVDADAEADSEADAESVVEVTDETVSPELDPELEDAENEAENETNSEADLELDGADDDTEATELTDDLSGFQLPSFDSGVFTVGESGEIAVEYLYDGGAYRGELAIFSLRDLDMTYDRVEDFIATVAQRAASESDLGHIIISDRSEGARFESSENSGTYRGVKTVAMKSGDRVAFMLVPNSTISQVANNPEASGSVRPLFSLATANPDDAFHFGQMADVTGDDQVYVLEDQRADGSSDRDYNDVVFAVSGASGNVAQLDDVVASPQDWHTSELAQQLEAYVRGDTNESEDPTSDPTDQPDETENLGESAQGSSEIDAEPDTSEESLEDMSEAVDDDSDTEQPNRDEDEVRDTHDETHDDTVADEPNGTDENGGDRDEIQDSDDASDDVSDDVEDIVDETETGENIENEDNREEDTENLDSSEPIAIVQYPIELTVDGETLAPIALEGLFAESIAQFPDPEAEIAYTILDDDLAGIAAIENGQLTIDSTQIDSFTTIVMGASDADGNTVTQTIAIDLPRDPAAEAEPVEPLTVTTEQVEELENDLDELAEFLDTERNWEDQTPEQIEELDLQWTELVDTTLATLTDNPEIIGVLIQSGDVSVLGLSETASELLAEAIATPELLAELSEDLDFGTSLTNALDTEDPAAWDLELLNAEQAASLLPSDAELPQVAVLDFEGIHGEAVTETIGLVNSGLAADFVAIDNVDWAAKLIETVDRVQAESDEPLVVNLSFDLTMRDDIGEITRYQLAESERAALEYAQERGVLLVAASGNTGGLMSALGDASQEFDNIVTVGAVDRLSEVADYSSRGDGLTLVAPGGSYGGNPDAFVGTSRATAYVTGAASLVWAANPGLSYQQVKELLAGSSVDLGVEGWDAETGAGLLDVTEAVMAAALVAPAAIVTGDRSTIEGDRLDGTGRGTVLTRAASPTAATIEALREQQAALEAQLSGADGKAALTTAPDLTLEELRERVAQTQDAALAEYRDLDVDYETAQEKALRLAEAQDFAALHREIEGSRLRQIEVQKAELEQQFAALQAERADLVETNPQQLAQIEAAIAQTEEAIAASKEKLQYQLIDPETLSDDPAVVREEAAAQRALAAEYRADAEGYANQLQEFQTRIDGFKAQEAESYRLAASVPRYTHSRGRCGRWKRSQSPTYTRHIRDAQAWARRAQEVTLPMTVAQQNFDAVSGLANQMESQVIELDRHAKFLESQQSLIEVNSGKPEEAKALLESLQTQAREQAELAEAYTQQAIEAEKRRKQNLDDYNYHKSQAVRRHTGYRYDRRCRKRSYHYYTYHPEHYEPRDLAYQEYQLAAQEVGQFDKLAQESQAKAEALKVEAEALAGRIEDWPSIKQGIEYEGQADELKLQAEKDLIDLQEPVQRQQIETLDLKIAQAEAALADIAARLPKQAQKASDTETRFDEIAAEFQAIQGSLGEAQRNRQDFLETKGFLLPQAERDAAIEQHISQLEAAEIVAQEEVNRLAQLYAQQPSEAIAQQLEAARDNADRLQAERDWARGWKEQLALVNPGAPEQLALDELIADLEQRRADDPAANTLDLDEYLATLKEIRDSQGDITSGFVNAAEKLAAIAASVASANDDLLTLQDSYRELGNDREDIEAEKALDNHIDVIDAQIGEAVEVLDGYNGQISEANQRVAQLESQRAQAQANANWWNGQIWTTRSTGKKGGTERVYNANAEAERNKAQAAADNYAAQRDAEADSARALEAALQPDIAQAQANIDGLEERKTRWQELEDLPLEEAIATLKSEGDDVSGLEERLQDIDDRLAAQDEKLSDKYTELDLTESYLNQLQREANRLEHRRDLQSAAGNLEQQYDAQEATWNAATQAQNLATTTLLATRNVGADDRNQLATLQTELNAIDTELATLQAQEAEIGTTAEEAQKAVEFTELQLKNRELQAITLAQRDTPLAGTQQYYFDLAQQHRQKIWRNVRGQYVYDANQAAAYRTNLQKASLIAEERNQVFARLQRTEAEIAELTPKLAEQQAELATQASTLETVEAEIAPLSDRKAELEAAIAPITERLQPLQAQETAQTTAFRNATRTAQTALADLGDTLEEQVASLNQLMSFGLLGSESDLNLFPNQIAPQVEDYIARLETRDAELATQQSQLDDLLAGWQTEQATLTDDESLAALDALIADTTAQREALSELRAATQGAVRQLRDRLEASTAALEDLRQSQEREVREQLDSNVDRLAALEALLAVEEAADAATAEDSVLGYAQLNDAARQALYESAIARSQQLQEGHAQTKAQGEDQAALSGAVDALLDRIESEFGDPHGDLARSRANLRDALQTLAVVAPREDEIREAVGFVEDEIELLKLMVAQDAALWEEIKPITERLEAEKAAKGRYDSQLATIETLQDDYLNTIQAKLKRIEEAQAQAQSHTDSAAYHAPRRGYESHGKSGIVAILGSISVSSKKNSHWNAWEHHTQQAAKLNQEIAILQQEVAALLIPAKEQATSTGVIDIARDLANNAPEHSQYLDELEALKRDLGEYESSSSPALDEAKQLVAVTDGAKTLLRPTFVENATTNGTAIDLLQAETEQHYTEYRQQLNESTAEQTQTDAQSAAVIAQAQWYADQAAKHWELSRKNGPFWYEWRKTYRRTWYGKKKTKWVKITHIDHHWILWNTYSKYAQQLRAQGVDGILDRNAASREEERLIPLVEQWGAANTAAHGAATPIGVTRNLVEVLEAARSQLPTNVEQLDLLEGVDLDDLPAELRAEIESGEADIELMNATELEALLPTLQAELAQAEIETDSYTDTANTDWNEFDTAREDYTGAIESLLAEKGDIQQQAQALQHDLADSEAWVERQNTALAIELQQVNALRDELIAQSGDLVNSTEPDAATKLAQLQETLGALDNKAAILTAEQASLGQKRTLLAAQNEVVLAEQALISAYLESPDADFTQLQLQLDDARAALAEAQRLAEQAEASSNALTEPLQKLQSNLLEQNDEHLAAAKDHQSLLKALLEATELNANYTLEAAQKQAEVNDLEFQLQQRLQEMAEAGLEEAKHLLDVATNNDMATAAALYYRDYRDLASDRGGSCSGGIARSSDRVKADRYYREMLKYRELQRRAQTQANHFGAIKDAADTARKDLEARQTALSEELSQLSDRITETEAEKTEKEQAVAITQARLEAISGVRDRTEQTFVQLVMLEQLNLGQAELEREIAEQRQAEIEAAVEARLERERIELERQRLIAQSKLEQLRQLQAEDELREALNAARGDLGLEELTAEEEDEAQSQALMAELAQQIADFTDRQPDLPDDVKDVLATTRAAMFSALDGEVEQVARENLTEALGTLLIEGDRFRNSLNDIYREAQEDAALLEQARDDVSVAAQMFADSLDDSRLLAADRDVLNRVVIQASTQNALANQSVKISFELAQEAFDVLKKIIDIRKAERKARERAFWGELVQVLSMVVNIIGMVFPKLKPITLLISAAINAIWAAVNGDWVGAIFGIVMAAAQGMSTYLGKVLASCTCVTLFGKQVARSTIEAVKRSLDAARKLGAGVKKGIKAIQSDDDIKGILHFVQGVASAVVTGLSGQKLDGKLLFGDAEFKTELLALPGGTQIWGLIDALQTAPVSILEAIRAIEDGETFNGITKILGEVFSAGQKMTDGVLDSAFQVLDMANDTAIAVKDKFIDKGGVWGWLEGIGKISTIWTKLPDAVEKATKDLKVAKNPEKGNCPTVVANFLGEIVDATKLQKAAKNIGAFANGVENLTYTGLAFAKAIEGATKGMEEMIDSWKEAGDYLYKGWKNDLKKMKEQDKDKSETDDITKDSAYVKLLKHLKSIGNMFGAAGEDLLDLDLEKAYNRAKDAFDKFFSGTTNKAVWATFKDLLDSFKPLILQFP